MKLVIFIALIALAASEGGKSAEDETLKRVKRPGFKKRILETPEAAKNEEHKGLQWPLPDPDNEGDLILHGAHLFDRVEELHKGKLEKDEDKMILSVGREYLIRVLKYIEKTTDFKILPELCLDSRRLNSTKRWEIRIRPGEEGLWLPPWSYPSPPVSKRSTDNQENPPIQSEQAQDPIVPSNSIHENGTETDGNFEVVNEEFYKRMGDNFARLLLKKYRKEELEMEFLEYLERWSSEESVHYGFMGIYCHEGENVEEIRKRISTFLDEKA